MYTYRHNNTCVYANIYKWLPKDYIMIIETHTHTHTHAHTHTRTHTHTHTHTHIHTHTHTHIHTVYYMGLLCKVVYASP